LLARVLTLALVLLEILDALAIRNIFGDRAVAFVNQWLWLAMCFYINIQLLETCRRNSNDLRGFFFDSGYAIIAIMVPIGFFVWDKASNTFRLPAEELQIMIQCMAWMPSQSLSSSVISVVCAAASMYVRAVRPPPVTRINEYPFSIYDTMKSLNFWTNTVSIASGTRSDPPREIIIRFS
jgi:hypothetical protein